MFQHLLAIDGSDHAHPHVVNTLIDLQELERIDYVSHKLIHLSDVPVLAVR